MIMNNNMIIARFIIFIHLSSLCHDVVDSEMSFHVIIQDSKIEQ